MPNDFLEEREFYERMQAYRHTNPMDQERVVAAFEAVKDYVRAQVQEMQERLAEFEKGKEDCPNCKGQGRIEMFGFREGAMTTFRCSVCKGKRKI